MGSDMIHERRYHRPVRLTTFSAGAPGKVATPVVVVSGYAERRAEFHDRPES